MWAGWPVFGKAWFLLPRKAPHASAASGRQRSAGGTGRRSRTGAAAGVGARTAGVPACKDWGPASRAGLRMAGQWGLTSHKGLFSGATGTNGTAALCQVPAPIPPSARTGPSCLRPGQAPAERSLQVGSKSHCGEASTHPHTPLQASVPCLQHAGASCPAHSTRRPGAPALQAAPEVSSPAWWRTAEPGPESRLQASSCRGAPVGKRKRLCVRSSPAAGQPRPRPHGCRPQRQEARGLGRSRPCSVGTTAWAPPAGCLGPSPEPREAHDRNGA